MSTIGTLIKPATVVILDQECLLRWAIKKSLEGERSWCFAGEAGTVVGSLQLVGSTMPDAAVMGLVFPDGTGLGLIQDLLIQAPSLRILVHSSIKEAHYAERCLRLGAKGYVTGESSGDQLLEGLRHVLSGKLYVGGQCLESILDRLASPRRDDARDPVMRLSSGELEVFQLIGQGMGNREIAATLHRSVKTIETYRTRIKGKLGLANAVELAQVAYRNLNAHTFDRSRLAH